ncbi:DUF5694 domain-containing protein [Aliicoccus persicus]
MFNERDPSNSFLKSLQTLRDSLSTFQPTDICIEIEEKNQDEIDEHYQSYDKNRFYKYESYDLGFYLGKKNGIKSIRAVDWMENDQNQNGISDAVEWAEQHDPEFMNRLTDLQNFHNQLGAAENIYDATLKLNHPENYKRDQELYGHMMLLGDKWEMSIPWLAWWYKRNMIMVNNITRNLKDDSRVIMIVGAGHIYILKQLLESSGKFDVKTFHDWEENR